jgi:acetate CoA/acetoacetate CoA-transferase alpha subunit
MKKSMSLEQFSSHIKDGMTIMVGGFMTTGTSEVLMDALVKTGVKDLTVICNDAGFPNKGVGKLITNRQVKCLITSHIGLNPEAGEGMTSGWLDVLLVPQGTLAEQIRAGGSGLGGVLTKTGLGTMVEENKTIITIDGEDYLLEKPLKADLALLRGSIVDQYGNVFYRATTRNFNPLMAMAADTVIVGCEALVDELDPNHVMTPHVLVDYVIKESL